MKTEFEISKLDIRKEILEFRSGCKDFKSFWDSCRYGDWLLEIAYELGVDEKLMIKTRAECVNMVRHLIKDKRSLDVIDAALSYCEGKLERKDLTPKVDSAFKANNDAFAMVQKLLGTKEYDNHRSMVHATYAAYYIVDCAYASAIYVDMSIRSDYNYGFPKDYERKITDFMATVTVCREYLTENVFEKIKNLK